MAEIFLLLSLSILEKLMGLKWCVKHSGNTMVETSSDTTGPE